VSDGGEAGQDAVYPRTVVRRGCLMMRSSFLEEFGRIGICVR